MGVKGFYRVLVEEGWLPDDASSPCCSTSIWRDPKVMHDCPKFAANVSLVKKRSTIFVDGAGLCFHLYRIAYARHAAEVLNQSSNGGRRRSSSSRPCSARHLKQDQVTKLLPNLAPLNKLDEVTREFVDTLKKRHHMKLIVYFDGDKRREAKRETDEKRQQKRPVEWSALQQYCCNGIMPSVERVCQWEECFPKNRLFISQVKYTLQLLQVDVVVCEEEADSELARQAARTQNSYVAAMDTDFCFFKGAKYIPLMTLHANGSVVTACVVSRKGLAESLHLPDEQAMVELSILMGNDYVGTSAKDKFDFASRNARDIMDHLRANGKGYRVTSTSGEQTAEGIRFARSFYNLKDLESDEFPLVCTKERAEGSVLDGYDGLVMKVPSEFPDHLAVVQPQDISLVGTVIRCMQAYVDKTKGKEDAVLRQEHVDALKLLSHHRQDENSSVAWRPSWEDIPACYLIESCVGYIIKRSGGSPLVRLSPPSKVFDAYKFHYTLFKLRNKENPTQQPTQMSETQKITQQVKEKKVERLVLPIDEHEENIVNRVNQNRVTIIQGETGCGKSSRVPIMIMNAPVPENSGLKEVKLFISQPRRIAAKALVERLRATEPEHGKRIALRMGHGVREYENSGTKAWFVTTGYLVRLLSNHPDNFKKVSHLIIDEIHERSVDTDILCLLCRRLIHTHTHIRLVLMSATLAAQLYQDYFGNVQPPIKVGARRFPIKEIFVEDLAESFQLSPKEVKAVRQIEAECAKTCCIAPPSNNAMESIYSIAARVAIAVGKPGSSVLIFVPGMKDIESITELVERLYVPGVTYTCIPVHSDIPFDDQMVVFDETEEECKIIIATNACESSITLPDCDHVICTGLQKQIIYNKASHRQMLLPCWISRASAQQRSGRVGRVRPGTVFRLYTKEAYESMMQQFESGEMLRMPLDSVILMLKEILHEETTPALLNCLEPPDLSTIERSYESLHEKNFISEPDDSGAITVLGAFVSALGIDLALGALIGLGIQFGVGPEAIELAAVLSFPKTPWILSNPLVHKPKAFNVGTVKTYVSRNHFDASIFSEPLGVMNLINEYSRLHGSRLSAFCNYHGVHNTRIKRLISTKKNLVSRVAEFVKLDPSLLKVTVPPSQMHHSKLTILRVIQTWVFHDTIIEYNPLPFKPGKDGSFNVALKTHGTPIDESQLSNLLRSDRHPHTLKASADIEQAGGFEEEGKEFDLERFISTFEERFVSYITEKQVDLAWFWSEQGLQLYPSSEFYESHDFQDLRKLFEDMSDKSALYVTASGSHRGRGERACGRWSIQDPSKLDESDSTLLLRRKYTLRETVNGVSHALRNRLRKCTNLDTALSFDFSKNLNRKKARRNNAVFQIFCTGSQAFKVSDIDLCDLLGIPRVKDNHYLVDRHERRSQYLQFSATDTTRHRSPSNGGSPSRGSESLRSSVRQPLLRDAPEGMRLLAVLAASRRREHNILIPISREEAGSEADLDGLDDDQFVSFALDNGLSRMLSRWTRFNTDKAVFVFENSVPASVIPVEGITSLYACCANTLDLRGGGLRAEGLTLLPPGSLFLLLALLAFGVTPDGLGRIPHHSEELDDFIASCTEWIKQKDSSEVKEEQEAGSIDPSSRIRMAIDFGRSCVGLGEKLVCFPDKVKSLCAVFDFVDGYESELWPKVESNPFIPLPDHMRRSRDSLLASLSKPGSSYGDVKTDGAQQALFDGVYTDMQDESGRIDNKPLVSRRSNAVQEAGSRQSNTGDNEAAEEPLRGKEVHQFSDEMMSLSESMFAAGLNGEAPDSSLVPSTNVLALIMKQFYAGLVYEAYIQPDRRHELLEAVKRFSDLRLAKDFWTVQHFEDHEGKDWYRALFVEKVLSLKTRSTRGMRGWLKNSRPEKLEHALECVPPEFRCIAGKETQVYEYGAERRNALLFETIEVAVCMEAAFCLERLFSHINKRWYDQSFPDIMQHMHKRVPASSEILRRLNS